MLQVIKQQESRSRVIDVDGIPVLVDDQRGAFLVWAKPVCKQKALRVMKLEKEWFQDMRNIREVRFFILTFEHNRRKRANRWIAVSPLLEPGPYALHFWEVGLNYVSLEERLSAQFVEVEAGGVAQVDWRRL